jgi:hypothetical protein
LQAYRISWHANSDAIRVLVDVISELEGFTSLRGSYRSQSDVYSALGATKVAILGSALSAIGAAFALHWEESLGRLGAISSAMVPYLVVSGLVSFQLTRNRRGARKTLVRVVQSYLALSEQRLREVLARSQQPSPNGLRPLATAG